jgi:hypothetical protein
MSEPENRNEAAVPSETSGAAERREEDWSDWERQKLDVYRREHPGEDQTESPVKGESG